MILPVEQTQRFYRIWWALLRFVNRERKLFSELPETPEVGSLPWQQSVDLRQALWEDSSLLQSFIDENPYALPQADIDMVSSWCYRLEGKFFIMRHLKKYTVFLDSGDPPRAYGVLGLVSPIEEIIGTETPLMVEAVLLPFEDKIIYDGMLAPYSIYFGKGIRDDLELSLRDAKEREGVITSLIPQPSDADELRKAIEKRNAKLLAEFRKELFKPGLSEKMVSQHTDNIKAFADHLLRREPSLPLLEINEQLVKEYIVRVETSKQKAVATSFKRFIRFLYDTMRLHPETAWDIRESLKLYEPSRGKRSSRRKGQLST
ncbi:MAG TPA: hypothetical protein VID27_02205 [Blastocatellia bacterium]|jgi:hypothetical protein